MVVVLTFSKTRLRSLAGPAHCSCTEHREKLRPEGPRVRLRRLGRIRLGCGPRATQKNHAKAKTRPNEAPKASRKCKVVEYFTVRPSVRRTSESMFSESMFSLFRTQQSRSNRELPRCRLLSPSPCDRQTDRETHGDPHSPAGGQKQPTQAACVSQGVWAPWP